MREVEEKCTCFLFFFDDTQQKFCLCFVREFVQNSREKGVRRTAPQRQIFRRLVTHRLCPTVLITTSRRSLSSIHHERGVAAPATAAPVMVTRGSLRRWALAALLGTASLLLAAQPALAHGHASHGLDPMPRVGGNKRAGAGAVGRKAAMGERSQWEVREREGGRERGGVGEGV